MLYRLDIFSSMVAIFTLLSGMLFLSDSSNIDTTALSILLILFNVVMSAIFILLLVLQLFDKEPNLVFDLSTLTMLTLSQHLSSALNKLHLYEKETTIELSAHNTLR